MILRFFNKDDRKPSTYFLKLVEPLEFTDFQNKNDGTSHALKMFEAVQVNSPVLDGLSFERYRRI